MTNQEIIDKFFEAFMKHDFTGIREVLAENVTWHFLGQPKLAGVKNGVAEVVSFFDTMGAIMSKSKPEIEKLIVSSNSKYLIECQNIKTNRDDGININHSVCVLWTFENGKIVTGRHYFSDPVAARIYFNAVASKE